MTNNKTSSSSCRVGYYVDVLVLGDEKKRKRMERGGGGAPIIGLGLFFSPSLPFPFTTRYTHAYGDTWGGQNIPPESNLEFDLELIQINQRHSSTLKRALLSRLGPLVKMIRRLLRWSSSYDEENDDESLGGWWAGDREEEEEEEMEEEEVVEDEDTRELEEMRKQWLLWKQNKAASMEAHALFAKPMPEVR